MDVAMRPVDPHGAAETRPNELAAAVKRAARGLGFEAAGICDLRPIERRALLEWLERGYAGRMAYMQRQAARRQAPALIAAGSTRAVVALTSYVTAAREATS